MSVQETYLAAIADAIRAKEGSTDPIPASSFAERIAGIQTEIVSGEFTNPSRSTTITIPEIAGKQNVILCLKTTTRVTSSYKSIIWCIIANGTKIYSFLDTSSSTGATFTLKTEPDISFEEDGTITNKSGNNFHGGTYQYVAF